MENRKECRLMIFLVTNECVINNLLILHNSSTFRDLTIPTIFFMTLIHILVNNILTDVLFCLTNTRKNLQFTMICNRKKQLILTFANLETKMLTREN